jgi:endogenous inhibitor of DNA gyrase (YacG/DUF329 family)
MPPRPEIKSEAPKSEAPKSEATKPDRKARGCPICGRPADVATKPFCSSRCRDVDLHRWLSGSYVVPGSENDEEDQG